MANKKKTKARSSQPANKQPDSACKPAKPVNTESLDFLDYDKFTEEIEDLLENTDFREVLEDAASNEYYKYFSEKYLPVQEMIKYCSLTDYDSVLGLLQADPEERLQFAKGLFDQFCSSTGYQPATQNERKFWVESILDDLQRTLCGLQIYTSSSRLLMNAEIWQVCQLFYLFFDCTEDEGLPDYDKFIPMVRPKLASLKKQLKRKTIMRRMNDFKGRIKQMILVEKDLFDALKDWGSSSPFFRSCFFNRLARVPFPVFAQYLMEDIVKELEDFPEKSLSELALKTSRQIDKEMDRRVPKALEKIIDRMLDEFTAEYFDDLDDDDLDWLDDDDDLDWLDDDDLSDEERYFNRDQKKLF